MVKLIKQQEKNWEEKRGFSKKILVDKTTLNIKGSLVQLVKIKPGEVADEHFHKKQTEIFYFLTEEGSWIINGNKLMPKIGEIIVIEPGDRHEVRNESHKDYVYLVFKYNYEEGDSYYE